jgi:hypothetical protein
MWSSLSDSTKKWILFLLGIILLFIEIGVFVFILMSGYIVVGRGIYALVLLPISLMIAATKYDHSSDKENVISREHKIVQKWAKKHLGDDTDVNFIASYRGYDYFVTSKLSKSGNKLYIAVVDGEEPSLQEDFKGCITDKLNIV